MEFCPTCKIILIRKDGKFVCPKCGHSKNSINLSVSEKLEKKEAKGSGVFTGAEALPIVRETCPKCRNDEAFTWAVQMRGSDEGETSFFRCAKCRHTWRKNR